MMKSRKNQFKKLIKVKEIAIKESGPNLIEKKKTIKDEIIKKNNLKNDSEQNK